MANRSAAPAKFSLGPQTSFISAWAPADAVWIYGSSTSRDTATTFSGSATAKINYSATLNNTAVTYSPQASGFTHSRRYGLWVKNNTQKRLILDVLFDKSGTWAGGSSSIERLVVPVASDWQLVEWWAPASSFDNLLYTAGVPQLIKQVRIRRSDLVNNGWASGDSVNIGPLVRWRNRAKVLLTFDDGIASQYTTAKPILDAYGYKATCYVVPQLFGGTSAAYSAPLMTYAQADDLYASGWDICNHLSQLDFWKTPYNSPALTVTPSHDGATTLTLTFNRAHGLRTVGDWLHVAPGTINLSAYRNWLQVASIPDATSVTVNVAFAGAASGSGTLDVSWLSGGARYLDDAAFNASIRDCDTILSARYPRSAKHLAWPEGGYDVRAETIFAELGMKTMRGVHTTVNVVNGMQTGMPYMYDQNYAPFDSCLSRVPPYTSSIINIPGSLGLDAGNDFTNYITPAINQAIEFGGLLVTNAHNITGTTTTNLQSTVDLLRSYEKQGLVDVGMTINEWHEASLAEAYRP